MLIPFGDYVLLQPIKEKITESGIVLNEETKTFICKGTIVSVSEEYLKNHLHTRSELKVGDIVYFGQYSPEVITIDGTDYMLIKALNIVGKEG